ncbi:MAG: hypothetical protein FWH08_04515 [Oscillospiraceae bacterium]|nr:hypothetical protein [Oscillospiraceae bacterium]
MKKTIEDLFFGDISPNLQKNNQKLVNKIENLENELTKLLNDKEKALFNSYLSRHSELIAETALTNFEYGFKLGVCLTAESLI